MDRPWENENCAEIHAYYSIYPVPVAAALWCEVPPKEVDKYLSAATEVAPGVFRHPSIKCLEVKCRAMQNAIIANTLPVSREDGRIVTDHVAPARRHVSRQHLKEWISKEFPSNKPAFLFDELERKSHSAINADTFRALQADRDALQTENEKLRALTKKLTDEKDALRGENESLKTIVQKNNTPDPRSEATLLNIIGCLLKLILSKSPNDQPYSSFKSQAAIISVLLAHFGNIPGISDRTLEQKFADANRSIAAT
jgi:FtsZ-binding cell division protein ZapB